MAASDGGKRSVKYICQKKTQQISVNKQTWAPFHHLWRQLLGGPCQLEKPEQQSQIPWLNHYKML